MIETGALDQPTSLLLTATTVTDVLTMAAGEKGTRVVTGALIVNEDTTARLVTLFWTKDATDYKIFRNTVGANESVSITFEAPIKLFAKVTARKIRAQAAAANVVTVTIFSTTSQQQNANES